MPDNLLTLIDTAINYLNANMPTNNFWGALFDSTIFSTFVGAAISLVITRCTTHWAEKQTEKKQKIEEYEKKLKDFYNPLYFLIVKNTKLYEIFKVDKKYKNKRTLLILLDQKDVLSDADKSILEEIIANNHEILQLINQNAGYIEDDMMDDFVELARHYVLLEKAFQNKLPNLPEYREHTYPRDINTKIKNKVKALRSEIMDTSPKEKKETNESK
ncbi:hypothetical protein INF35_07785 [Subdoligranulum sp. DSM 109015]|uniref:Uncharacterized protein n=1 Tax=Gemmiger gallinarum TaxID=2779354 RepID=A0ABR9R3G2_9FIRM|nr:hypothetical protein [Gemmiger gallinarum]MBE5037682.1 hypothetical protein [Gemmiger gallinarum]